MRRHRPGIWLLLGAGLAALLGCGGRHVGGGVVPPDGETPGGDTSARSSLVVTILWPEETRVIPSATKSVRISIGLDRDTIGSQLVPRPSGETTSTVSFADLPATTIMLSTIAYPNADGTGIPLAEGTATVALSTGANTAAVTMASTIASVQITPGMPSVLQDQTASLTATGIDRNSNLVLIPPGNWSWTSENAAVATVTATGEKATVKGVATGTAVIRATEVDSGKSGTVTVTVGGPPPFSFRAPVDVAVAGPTEIAAVDMDGDRHPDLTTNDKDGYLVLFWGDGTGGFVPGPRRLPPGSPGARFISTFINGDTEGDGRYEKVFAIDSKSVRVWSFDVFPDRDVDSGYDRNTGGTLPTGVACLDLDRDGRLDAVTVNNGSDNMGLVITYTINPYSTPPPTIATGSRPTRVVAGDWNGDGKGDVAVTNSGSDTVGIYLGNGTGGLSLKAAVGVGAGPSGLARADLNRDGKMDLAVSNTSGDSVSILLGNGDGTFAVSPTYPAGTSPSSIQPLDVDGDGYLDLAIANSGQDYVSILRGLQAGTFAAPIRLTVGGMDPGRSLAVADFNHDGKPDLAIANTTANRISVWINNTVYGATLGVTVN